MKVLHLDGLPPNVLTDDVVFIRAVRTGIPGKVVQEAVELLGGHRELVAALVGSTPGNIQRIYSKPALGKVESEGILDLLRLFAYASAIFDSDDIVREWLRCHLPALSGSRPADLLDTFQGRIMVRDVLNKIERGEFS
ncbi:antitoxin Xre/MbcA/ParS toxin-binding domain-containing protein [Halomonas sp.]|uniref:antitoxin Xre/MbcA/ParS toxin-binding domain-containing protein n=1 Tax=Halomonas sp. TaxID=1486246 RepID=UPI00298EA01C|nr:antitoxin Xre/MbcA/ParS toxin-binding domain-containing protein [Halomonas sp.]MDW7749006.1 antitoxin Xre/MbcA/ParS toxin-binding domain-containing protein [Halomonas sp.]